MYVNGKNFHARGELFRNYCTKYMRDEKDFIFSAYSNTEMKNLEAKDHLYAYDRIHP